jgi:hypothetical protein
VRARRALSVAERFPALRGINAGLLTGLVVVVLAGGAWLLGPARDAWMSASSELAERVQRQEIWAQELAGFRDANDEERLGWSHRWRDVVSRVALASDDPALTAHVADALQAPTARELEIQIVRPAAGAEPDERTLRIALESPDGEEGAVFEWVPLSARLLCSFRDALEILSRLESRTMPVRVDSLEITRAYPDVAIAMELTYLVRRPN